MPLLYPNMMPDNSEIIHYENPEFPVYIRFGLLSIVPGMQYFCHWHEDLEFIYIINGEMNYKINDKTILLEKGDSLFVNAKRLHFGHSNKGQECEFICFLFHPSLFTNNTYFRNTFVLPVIENKSMEYLHFTKEVPYFAEVGQSLQNLFFLKNRMESPYEILLLTEIYNLWSYIYKSTEHTLDHVLQESNEQLLQKQMVSYIQEHFAEPLTLNEIAASVNISRSKCCMIFKKYINQSPVDFLISYRLMKSCYILEETDMKITEIALHCGFNNPSYFSKLFQKKYGCSPMKYRRQYKTEKK